jgi:hypothetical protein
MKPIAAPVTFNLWAAIFIFLVNAPNSTLAASEDLHQRTFPSDLREILCMRQVQSQDFVKSGIYDSQIVVSKLTPNTPQDHIKEAAVRETSMRRARDHSNLSFAYGLCNDGSAWIASMPSSQSIILKNASIEISPKLISKCAPKTLQIRYAAAQKGRSMLVPQSRIEKGNIIAELPSAKGVVAVSCTLLHSLQDGPRELAMIPTGGFEPAEKELKLSSITTKFEALDWINSKRRENSIPEFSNDQLLTNAAVESAATKSVKHNTKSLNKLGDALLKSGINPIGEDRVIASTWAEALKLFWISPFHRDLLLNPNANLAGFSSRPLESGQLIVVFMAGQKSSGNVSKLENSAP